MGDDLNDEHRSFCIKENCQLQLQDHYDPTHSIYRYLSVSYTFIYLEE